MSNTIRLSNTKRQEIAGRIVDARYRDRETVLTERMTRLGDWVWESEVLEPLGGATYPIEEIRRAVPHEMFRMANELPCHMRVPSTVDESRGAVNKFVRLPMSSVRAIPLGSLSFSYWDEKKLDYPYATIYHELDKEQQALRTDRQEEWQYIFQALVAFRTVKRLLEDWPEIEPFLPAWAFKEESDKSLPQGDLSNLRKITRDLAPKKQG